MRSILILTSLVIFSTTIFAQQYYSIKVDNKWGLIDAEGKVVLDPTYEALGDFKSYGYAVMQRDGGVGLININRTEIISPKYDDIKVLDSLLIAVMDNSEWMVINLQGQVILEKGYQRVHVWDGQYLAYLRDKKWGLANADGSKISDPKYDEIELLDEGYFQTKIENNYGLISKDGTEILPASYESVRIYDDRLFFFQQEKMWGAANIKGEEVIAPKFNTYQKISENFLKLVQKKKVFLYSMDKEDIITNDEFHNFYAFNSDMVLSKLDRKLGLLNDNGEEVLPPIYNEIHAYDEGLYRVNVDGKWGVVRQDGSTLMDFIYNYISPLDDQVCIVNQEGRFGIVNFQGEQIVPTEYTKFELNDNEAKAYKGEALSLFSFDDQGQLIDENTFKKHLNITIGKADTRIIRRTGFRPDTRYLLDNFEWFYSSREDKWGLRRLDDASIQIKPTYDWIQIEREYGFTMVGIEKYSYHHYDRTEYRFDMIYGLVNNEVGMLTTDEYMWDIKLSDFRKGLPVARCTFDNSRHGLIKKNGKIIIKDYAFIGEFHDGLARMSVKGKLAGNHKDKSRGISKLTSYLDDFMSSYEMRDFTQHDRDFNEESVLTCEKCDWGYIDTTGQIIVPPQYTFARDFVNEVGIVQCDNKWGTVGTDATSLIPCNYDGIDFLENTDNTILKITINREKYGLIDTMGHVAVSLMYDEIGELSEGRLSVKRNNKWGFVNENGLEVIPCIYGKVKNFSEGHAVVKKGRKYGLINKNGDVLIDYEHNHLGNLKDGLTWFVGKKGRGFMNKNGDVIIEPKFQRIYDFQNGVARVVDGGEFGLIDANGNYILKPKYGNITPFNKNGVAIVRYGSNNIRYGVINYTGKMISSKGFNTVDPFQEGMAVVRYKEKYGFIDTTGQLVIPSIYSKVSGFSEGRAMVQKDGMCGYIDNKGKTIVPLQFSKCLDFDEGKAVVYKGYKKAGLIDLEGNYLIEPSINRIIDFTDGRGLVRDNAYRFYYITEQAKHYEGYYEKAGEFQHGVAVVQIDGRWGIINQKGIEIIPPKYDKIDDFENGYAKVRIKKFSGLANLQGELIVQPDYEYISYAGDGLFRVEQGDKVGYYDANGNWIWDLSK